MAVRFLGETVFHFADYLLFLIPPSRHIATRRRRLQETFDNFGGIHLMVAQPADGIGLLGVAIPAVLSSVAVQHLAAIGWVFGILEEIFHQVDGVV